jgi:hypothetical protein
VPFISVVNMRIRDMPFFLQNHPLSYVVLLISVLSFQNTTVSATQITRDAQETSLLEASSLIEIVSQRLNSITNISFHASYLYTERRIRGGPFRNFIQTMDCTIGPNTNLLTGVLQTFRPQGVQRPRSPFWRSKRPAQLGGTEANGSCHDVVVATDGVPLPQEMPQNKGFGLRSTFRTVILLLMGRPAPDRHRPGWSSQMIHRTTDSTQSRCCLQKSSQYIERPRESQDRRHRARSLPEGRRGFDASCPSRGST